MQESLHHGDGGRYKLICWCIMPNHVHAVILLYRGEDLSKVVHSWKSYTSHQINRLLGRQGRFWEKEYFDRLIRSERGLQRSIRYVLNNPGKAGLTDWPWMWLRDEY